MQLGLKLNDPDECEASITLQACSTAAGSDFEVALRAQQPDSAARSPSEQQLHPQ